MNFKLISLLIILLSGVITSLLVEENNEDCIGYLNCKSCLSDSKCSWCAVDNGFSWQGKCIPTQLNYCPFGGFYANATDQCQCLNLQNCTECLTNKSCGWCYQTLVCTGINSKWAEQSC